MEVDLEVSLASFVVSFTAVDLEVSLASFVDLDTSFVVDLEDSLDTSFSLGAVDLGTSFVDLDTSFVAVDLEDCTSLVTSAFLETGCGDSSGCGGCDLVAGFEGCFGDCGICDLLVAGCVSCCGDCVGCVSCDFFTFVGGGIRDFLAGCWIGSSLEVFSTGSTFSVSSASKERFLCFSFFFGFSADCATTSFTISDLGLSGNISTLCVPWMGRTVHNPLGYLVWV